MDTHKLTDFTRGWLIGDFEPTWLKTHSFEVGILTHKAQEPWPAHYQQTVTEYTVVLDGRVRLCWWPLGHPQQRRQRTFHAGQGFRLEPYEVAIPTFLTNVRVLVVKVPSCPTDKVLA